MNLFEFKQTWSEFLKSRGFYEIENVSLVPQNDPSLLLVNSGMFPLVPYLTGQVEPPSKNLFNIQRCSRFDDIEETGDNRHTTFFHMIGDWSIGDFFKETQIPMISEFLFEKMKMDPKRLYITVFAGNQYAPRDEDSIKLWQDIFTKYGITATVSNIKFDDKTADPDLSSHPDWDIDTNPEERIFAYPMKKNWWKRGDAAQEPGGPSSEMFYDMGTPHDPKFGTICHVNCDCGRFIEIGNNVFMQYIKNTEGGWDPLPQNNVDFGGGLERMIMASEGKSDIFETDDFAPIIRKLEELSGKKYQDENIKRAMRIIADHMRCAVFVIHDGVVPSNKDNGYAARRVLRRAVRFAQYLGIQKTFASEITQIIVELFRNYYPTLVDKQEYIVDIIQKEESKFLNTVNKGLKELEKLVAENIQSQREIISSEQIFNLYQTYGFPLEMTIEEVKEMANEKNISFDGTKALDEVKEFITKHQEVSRAGMEQKFKGGLADSAEETTRLHTAAHLFLEAARRVLGDHVHQRGSNITAERIRFDFSHPNKLTPEEIQKIEDIVNHNIDLELERNLQEYNTDEAFRLGAEGEFREKYGDNVNVYKFSRKLSEITDADKQSPYTEGIKKAIEQDPSITSHFKDEYVYSFEICGGPHVTNTSEIKKAGKFKITKEESSSAGIRRIKAELQSK